MRYTAVFIGLLFVSLLGAAVAVTGMVPRMTMRVGKTAISRTTSATDPLVPPLAIDFSDGHFSHDPAAVPHGHGENQCASGCAASRHPTGQLTAAAFHRLLTAYQQTAPTGENEALEKLLFYGRQSQLHWQRAKHNAIDPLWRTILDAELNKTHVRISLRILDEAGRVRSRINGIRVPLDRRHVFEMENEGLQPLVTSGTVKRVGLDHLWTRL